MPRCCRDGGTTGWEEEHALVQQAHAEDNSGLHTGYRRRLWECFYKGCLDRHHLGTHISKKKKERNGRYMAKGSGYRRTWLAVPTSLVSLSQKRRKKRQTHGKKFRLPAGLAGSSYISGLRQPSQAAEVDSCPGAHASQGRLPRLDPAAITRRLAGGGVAARLGQHER